MFHRIKSVKPLDGMCLLVTFRDGEQRVYDAKPLTAKWPSFKALEPPALFHAVQVDPGGFGVVWNDDLDLACDELWKHGTPVEEWDPD